MTTEFDSDEVVRQVTEKLATKFPETDLAEMKRIVAEEVTSLASQPVVD